MTSNKWGRDPETGFWEVTYNVDWFLPMASEVPAINLATLRRSTECSPQFQIAEKRDLNFSAENLEWNFSTDKHRAKT